MPMVSGRHWVNPPLDPDMARLPMQAEEVEKEIEQIQIVVGTGLELMALSLSLYLLNIL